MSKTALQRLVKYLLARQADDRALQLARHSVLDAAGCILAGIGSAQVLRLQAALGLDEPGPAARALRDGTAAHALDFDDYEELGSTHPGAVLVPALMALADQDNYTNAQVLGAYVSGYETILAMGRLLGYQHYLAGWHATSTIGRIGAAMACCRLLQLDSDRTVNAVSLAMTQAAGMKLQFGSDAKSLHAGLAARTGVEAAQLAQAGFTGAAEAGEGEAGFSRLYGTPTSPGWDRLFETGLPKINDHPPFLKSSPSCGYTLRAIEAAGLLSARQEFSLRAINRVTVDIARPYYEVAGIDRPKDASEARFSLAFCVASGLVDGQVNIASFAPKMLRRKEISDLSGKIAVRTYELPAELVDMSPQAPDTVTVHMKDGTELTETVAQVRGGPGRLLSSDELLEKYTSCGGRAEMARKFLQAGLAEPFLEPISR